MIARRSVWSDAGVQKVLARFVPVSDDVTRLQSGTDAECIFFQGFAKDGHAGGGDGTKQGTYAITPKGELLASINSSDAGAMRGMLARALTRWDALTREERSGPKAPRPKGGGGEPAEPKEPRWKRQGYPEDGLVLRVNTRDLPREREVSGWRGKAWNQDFAWFRKDEARAFLPEEAAAIVVGAEHEVPKPVVERLVRLHFVDDVRGETDSFRPAFIERAELRTVVASVRNGVVTLHLDGHTRTAETGRWRIDDDAEPSDQTRGFDARIVGVVVYNLAEERFVKFDAVAVGDRWGATRYNERHDDLAPQPMGVALTLASGDEDERIAPKFLWQYGW